MKKDCFELGESWGRVLREELGKGYVRELAEFVRGERESGAWVYPPEELVFNAFWKTPYECVRVVIIGQDPYHGRSQAHGLSFSVQEGVRLPPSLRNILKELSEDLGIAVSGNGCLEAWAKQGVLLLNATLTVNEGSPLSHHGKGWERFTDAVIDSLIKKNDPIIFVLWGHSAQKKAYEIAKNPIHFILTAPHPSPLSAHKGFFGCRHFSKINAILRQLGQKEIDFGL
jgi:uracil-DNA glycosylase